MKKIFHVVTLCFFLMVLYTDMTKVYGHGTGHDHTHEALQESYQEATESASNAAVPQYTLPFPGMLPTHPLYRLKLVRDQIIERLIKDPVKKSEFYLLQADKYLHMAIMLSQDGSSDAVDAVLGQSFDFRKQAFTLMRAHHETGSQIPTHTVENLMFSLIHHAQVLVELGRPSDPANLMLSEVRDVFYPVGTP